MKFSLKKRRKGLTLVELLVAIGALTIIFVIALILINPAKRFSQANNTKRRNDVNTILNAVNQYMADNNGTVPSAITGSLKNIGSGGTDADLCSLLVPTYVAEMPADPKTGTYTSCSSYDAQYSISTSAGSRITVTAPDAELSVTITLTR